MPKTEPILDGDTSFVGVNMRLDPSQLPQGFCSSARNKRFVNGKAATRSGIKKMPWTNKAHDVWSAATSYNANDIVTYSGLHAAVNANTLDGIATGTLVLSNANSLNLQNGDFSSSSAWVFTGATAVAAQTGTSGTTYTSESPFSIYSLSTGMSSGDTLTFQYGGVFTLSADASVGATSLQGTLTVADVSFQEEGSISSGWTYNAGGYAEITGGSGLLNLYQDIGTLVGCSYTVTYSVSNWTAGSVQPFISGTNSGTKRTYSGSATGTFTDVISPKGLKPQRLYIQASGGFRGRVDNVTVTPVSLPEKVDLLGTYEQYSNFFRAAGPSSNNSNVSGVSTDLVGPYFKASATNTNQTPITTYSAVSSPQLHSTAESTINSSYWTNLGHRTYGYGTVYGAGIFRDPNSVEYLLVATSDGVYATKESNPSTKLAGVSSISADVDFVQCFNVVLMFRGESLSPLMMERVDEGFKAISRVSSDTDIDENDDDGTETIPNGSTGLFFSNRLLIPHDKDVIAASDYLNYTRYQPVLSNFKINQGSEDELVSLVRINNSTIACFKTNSIYIVSNIYGNLSDITLDEVTREYGAVGRNSVVQVGKDVVFLSSKRGVTSLGIADNGKVTAVDVPLSDPIQPLIDRINWNYASGASAAYHNNRLYMAVPLDGATYNNAILVYDFLSQAWAGYDDGAAVKVKQFVETTYQGKRRLFFLSTDGFINLYDDDLTVGGFVDEVSANDTVAHADFGKIAVEQISDEVTTRGYTGNTMLSKRWANAEVQMATSDPTVTIKTVFDGAAENTKELTPTNGLTFDRTKYEKPFYASDFVESMSGNDFYTPYRQDYSVNPDTAIELGSTGFDPDLHQHSQNRFKYRGEGKYVQLEVKNTNGRAELLGVVVGGSPATQAAVKQV